jgi:hypothetical protein
MAKTRPPKETMLLPAAPVDWGTPLVVGEEPVGEEGVLEAPVPAAGTVELPPGTMGVTGLGTGAIGVAVGTTGVTGEPSQYVNAIKAHGLEGLNLPTGATELGRSEGTTTGTDETATGTLTEGTATGEVAGGAWI